MDNRFIQVRLDRLTRERLRAYARALQASGRAQGLHNAASEPSPDQCVARLLDQWERHRSRSHKSRNSS